MEYYLAPFTGIGGAPETGMAFRALGGDQPGASIIDLRPDPTVVDGYALLAVAVRADLPGQTYLGSW